MEELKAKIMSVEQNINKEAKFRNDGMENRLELRATATEIKVVKLDEKMTNLERKIGSIEVKMDQILEAIKAAWK